MDFFAVRTKINKKKIVNFFCYVWALNVPDAFCISDLVVFRRLNVFFVREKVIALIHIKQQQCV
jgi:hypothetical protein